MTMNTHIRIFLASIMIASFSCFSMAQQAQLQPKDFPDIEERVNRAIVLISKKLELSDLEKVRIKNVFSDFYKKTDQAFKAGEMSKKTIREKYKLERDAKIKLVLSKEKYEDYLQIIHELKPHPRRTTRKPQHFGKHLN